MNGMVFNGNVIFEVQILKQEMVIISLYLAEYLKIPVKAPLQHT